jgi:hypothetical protein
MIPFLKEQLVIIDCMSQRHTVTPSFPTAVGGPTCPLGLAETPTPLAHFQHDGHTLTVQTDSDQIMIDGAHSAGEHIQPESDHTLLAGPNLLLFRLTRNPNGWLKKIRKPQWRIMQQDGTVHAGPNSLQNLLQFAPRILEAAPSAILNHAATTTGFHLHSLDRLFPSAPPPPPEPTFQTTAPDEDNEPTSAIDIDSGEFTCPACWIRFDRGDTMHIAVHKSLKGDPVLGEDTMLRFLATNFNNKGQALDAMGIPTSEMACPHCRRKLPPGFLDLRQHIISIVGAPSSGKSYFLSVLTRIAKSSLYHHFHTTFQDGDPSENKALNAVTNKLFSASSPGEAMIAKTALEGDMYIRTHRMGREVLMPRPFSFTLTPNERPDLSFSTVFYDNAGEHFEPGQNSHEAPGAQHISAASGLIYLFDPTYNLSFRRLLRDHPDPQLADQRLDQQDTILSEMNVRVKTLQGLDFREKIETPIAFAVGKCDVWQHLLGTPPPENPLRERAIHLPTIQANSSRVRQLLIEVVPEVVANVESISSNVMYFPVSAFGSSPEVVCDENGKPRIDPSTGRKMFSPNPDSLAPILIDIPFLWLLSQAEPQSFPGQTT